MIHGQLGHLLSSALSLRRNVQIPREQKMSHLVNIWIHKVFTVFSQTLSHVVLMTILWREKGGFSFPWLSLPSLLLALFSPLPSLFFPFLFLSTAFFFLFFFFQSLVSAKFIGIFSRGTNGVLVQGILQWVYLRGISQRDAFLGKWCLIWDTDHK